MRRFSAASFLAALVTVFALLVLSACSGTSSNPNAVTKIILTPTSLSLNQGQVTAISAVAQNSAGSTVAADILFSSSNPALASVSSGGLICGGTWDANIIACTAASATGQVTITATSGTVTATMTIYVHQHVDRVVASAKGPCLSLGRTATMAVSVLNTSASGCSVQSPCDITSTVGPIIHGTGDTTILAVDSSTGVLTAAKPGVTTIFADVSGVNSVAQSYEVCRITTINVHSSTGSTTDFTLNPASAQTLVADVVDSAGVQVNPVLTWGTTFSSVATATVASSGSPFGTVTGVAPGTAFITATCSNPDCNANLPAQYALSVNTVTVPGGAGPTVYAASTNSLSLIPISSASDTIGTALTLPYPPNSIIADPVGRKVYLGSSSGMMIVTVANNTITTNTISGVILAVSGDSNYVIVSDPSTNTTNVYDVSTSSSAFTHPNTTTWAAITPDSKTTWFSQGNHGFNDSLSAPAYQFGLPFVPVAGAFNGTGALGYFTSGNSAGIDVRSTCNTSDVETLAASNPTLIVSTPSGAAVADSPNLDVITSSNFGEGCPATASTSITSHPLGLGSFNTKQMFVDSTGTSIWLISNLPQVVSFDIPTSVTNATPLVNGATPLSGGIRTDGQQAYFGASDGMVHRIEVGTHADVQQIAVGLKDSNGNTVNPNLVVVVP